MEEDEKRRSNKMVGSNPGDFLKDIDGCHQDLLQYLKLLDLWKRRANVIPQFAFFLTVTAVTRQFQGDCM